MRLRVIPVFVLAAAVTACQPTEPLKPLQPLAVDGIFSSSEPIGDPENLPAFTRYFGTGTSVIYSYVQLKNTETMTGAFAVRMRWFHPNDQRPPIANRDITMEPGQTIAQFSIHNEGGLARGPYMLIARAGKSMSELTASGSARFFVGMTEEEAAAFLEEEEAFIRTRDEERARRKAERKKQEEESQNDAHGRGGVPVGHPGEEEHTEDATGDAGSGNDDLPHALTDGAAEGSGTGDLDGAAGEE